MLSTQLVWPPFTFQPEFLSAENNVEEVIIRNYILRNSILRCKHEDNHSILTIIKMAISIMTIRKMTISIMRLRKMAISIMPFIHIVKKVAFCNAVKIWHSAECPNAEFLMVTGIMLHLPGVGDVTPNIGHGLVKVLSS